jgi:hypothetical protein
MSFLQTKMVRERWLEGWRLMLELVYIVIGGLVYFFVQGNWFRCDRRTVADGWKFVDGVAWCWVRDVIIAMTLLGHSFMFAELID